MRCPADMSAVALARIVSGLEFVHQTAKYIHCDVSPKHLLVSESGSILLIDGGFAVPIGKPVMGFSTAFAPHEVLRRKAADESPPIACGAMDLESLVKTVYAVLHPAAINQLHASLLTAKGRVRYAMCNTFWESEFNEETAAGKLWADALKTARSCQYNLLLEKLCIFLRANA